MRVYEFTAISKALRSALASFTEPAFDQLVAHVERLAVVQTEVEHGARGDRVWAQIDGQLPAVARRVASRFDAPQ